MGLAGISRELEAEKLEYDDQNTFICILEKDLSDYSAMFLSEKLKFRKKNVEDLQIIDSAQHSVT